MYYLYQYPPSTGARVDEYALQFRGRRLGDCRARSRSSSTCPQRIQSSNVTSARRSSPACTQVSIHLLPCPHTIGACLKFHFTWIPAAFLAHFARLCETAAREMSLQNMRMYRKKTQSCKQETGQSPTVPTCYLEKDKC